MSSEWHKLALQTETLPSLLFQYNWTREGYELYLTDLTWIWSERLRQKDIFDRAEQGSTTIDPSEGADQLDLLLTKIGDALSGTGGKPTLNSGSQADSIEINISAKLPAPLRPLQWKLQLSKEPISSLTNRILLPLLKDEAAWESRQRALLDQLRQKDWVLGKLFDRIEALGVDMGSIFPSAAVLHSARKCNARSEVAKLIKGVAPFDEQAWLAQTRGSSDSFNLASDIVHEIFGTELKNVTRDFSPTRDGWWNELEVYSTPAPQEDVELASKEEASEHTTANKSSAVQQAKHAEPDLDDGETTAGTTDSEFEVCEDAV